MKYPWFGWLLLGWSILGGCARTNYQYGVPGRIDPRPPLESVNPITFGGEHPKLDQVERMVHTPIEKLRQWFPRRQQPVDPLVLRQETLHTAQEYLVLNELTDVYIDVREYDPDTQWARLKANQSIHPFWKYTSGTVAHLGYAWLPGRVFHYDSYNPYTNTLTINSLDPARAIYEAAEAKYLRSRHYPGTFLAACYLPVVPLVKDVKVANDVLSYARVRQEWELEQQLTPQIYAAFGADLVSQATSLVPAAAYMPFYYKPLLSLAGRTTGRATGRAMVRGRQLEQKLLNKPDSP